MRAVEATVDSGAYREQPHLDFQIGDLLMREGRLSADDVGKVLAVARRDQLRFGEAAVQLGLISEADLTQVLSRQFAYPVVVAGSCGLNSKLVAAYEPYSAPAEALRDLRSQLRLRWFNAERRALAVCSARAEEGCSVVAANLAIAFAQLGEHALLIDCDMRNAAQQDLFGLSNGPGISNLLAGRGALRDAVVSIDAIPGLALLGAGAKPPNPQELLSRPAFRELLQEVSAQYSVVIIDTPPAMLSADAQTVAAAVGGALLVTRRNQSRFDDVQTLKTQFIGAGIGIVSSVITG